MLIYILLIAFIIIMFIYLRTSKTHQPTKAELKGLIGETRVNDVLKSQELTYYHDTLLKQGSISSQFDHIVVFRNKTILVIETKNKDGVISGEAYSENWNQSFGHKHYQFYNPVLQNEGHIKMLYNKMNKHKLYGYRVYSLVVFTSDKVTLKQVPSGVIHLSELPSTLRSLNKKTLFNRSRKFSRMIKSEDYSKSKRAVRNHKNFAQNAKKFKKK